METEYEIEYRQSMEQIAASLAHEVKNPLALVMASVDLLELNDDNEENAKSYKMMKRELRKINDLLLDFIQYTKPKHDEPSIIYIQNIICDIIDSLKTVYDKKIEFILDASPGEYLLKADGNKLRRVFVNLLKNAVEAVADDGKIMIDIRETRKYITVKITDNGVGLSPEDIRSLSTPFYTTKVGGSGLGLHISRTIIAEHGGTFRITGEKDGGCTVTVKLPRFV